MRLTTTLCVVVFASLAAACVAEPGTHRKPGSGSAEDGPATGPCTRRDGDVVVRSASDMASLPKTGCYDIYGKLTVQGQAITSLAGLGPINSVDELDLDHTGLNAIDSKRPLGIYGKLTVTGNAKLANLAQLSFEAASTGILIDGNAQLASLEPLGLADPALGEVDGDVVITGNPVLTTVPLGNLTRLTGALTVSDNAALTAIALGKLTTAGHIEITGNAQLASLGTMAALYRVSGNLMIDGNAALTSLAAFTTSLKFVDLALTITNNAALTDLGALKHMQLVGAIDIASNQSLVSCRAIEIDRCTQHPTAAVISGNKDGNCNWSCD
jgi:hypothetical protein